MQDLAALVAASDHFSDVLVRRPDAVGGCGSGRTPAPATRRPSSSRIAGALRGGRRSRPRDRPGPGPGGRRGRPRAPSTPPRPEVPFAVIGLGKLGGRGAQLRQRPGRAVRLRGRGPEDFRAAETAAERVLAEIRDGRLRGRRGPAARGPQRAADPQSVASYLEYWERWALLWEFQALLKPGRWRATSSSGGGSLGLATDFAYPEALPIDALAEVRRMRVRIEEERVRPPEARRFHFKLGYGEPGRRPVRGGALAAAPRLARTRRSGGGTPWRRSRRWPQAEADRGQRGPRPERGVTCS